MTFRFKLYRITTAIALMISGFFTFTLLSSVLFLGMNLGTVIFMLSLGACFIHSILSLYLQRSLLVPEIPLKESTPGGMRIMGTIGLIFALIMIFCGLTLVLVTPEQMKEAVLQLPEDQQAAIKQTMLKPIGVVCLLMGALFTLNINLSFRFLRQWQQQQNNRPEEEE
jgi:uncharacterized membrane protein YkgB